MWMLVAATPSGALLCWKAHPCAQDRSGWQPGFLSSQVAVPGTAAGAGTGELAHCGASGGAGSRGLVVLTPAESAAAFLHLSSLLVQESSGQPERRQRRGAVLSWVCSCSSGTSAPLWPEGGLKQRRSLS